MGYDNRNSLQDLHIMALNKNHKIIRYNFLETHKALHIPIGLANGTWHVNLHNHYYCGYNCYHSPTQVSVPVVLHSSSRN
jgi:hypothetical protein